MQRRNRGESGGEGLEDFRIHVGEIRTKKGFIALLEVWKQKRVERAAVITKIIEWAKKYPTDTNFYFVKDEAKRLYVPKAESVESKLVSKRKAERGEAELDLRELGITPQDIDDDIAE